MPTLELTYFDAPGRAEPIRVALHLAGLAFTDRRLKFAEFGEAKAKGEFPLGSVPVLNVDGVAMPETAGILRYIAKVGNTTLYPSDPRVALDVDSVLEAFNDTLSNALGPSFRERDMEKKLAMRAELANGALARVFAFAEKVVERTGGPFVAGATLSIADLVVGQQILAIRGGHLDGIGAEFLAQYPRLAALTDAYLAHPGVAAYRQSKL